MQSNDGPAWTLSHSSCHAAHTWQWGGASRHPSEPAGSVLAWLDVSWWHAMQSLAEKPGREVQEWQRPRSCQRHVETVSAAGGKLAGACAIDAPKARGRVELEGGRGCRCSARVACSGRCGIQADAPLSVRRVPDVRSSVSFLSAFPEGVLTSEKVFKLCGTWSRPCVGQSCANTTEFGPTLA